jgi:psp operon transcriptional activator
MKRLETAAFTYQSRHEMELVILPALQPFTQVRPGDAPASARFTAVPANRNSWLNSLKQAKYNQKRAAELLGLTYHQLRALLKKHQMR